MLGLQQLNNGLEILSRNEDAFSELELFHHCSAWVHDANLRIMEAENTGLSRDEIVSILAPAREIHSKSNWIKRLQDWPRGYQGDFETIELMIDGVNGNRSTVPSNLEQIALNCSSAQQHRNKVVFQERKIREACNRASNILSLACGGCIDAGNAIGDILTSHSNLYINDMDADAVALSKSRLIQLGAKLNTYECNVVDLFRQLNDVNFDLIMAGGLFDYLPDRVAKFVIKASAKLLKDGGELVFTNIISGNPFRPWIECLADWTLIERSQDDIMQLLNDAGVEDSHIHIETDRTGLTFLVTVIK